MFLPEIDKLSLAEQVAQMIVVRASGYLYDHQIQYPQWEPPNQVLQTWIKDYGVGGVILVGGSVPEIYLRSTQLQSWAKVPLLIAADVEEGVGQRFSGATHFPPPMALQQLLPESALKYAEIMGRITAIESISIGINWLMAPVVDVNNNPANPVINVRAFGETSEEVSKLTTAFIRGAKPYPVLTTAKHFPGHGDTSIDSHLQTPTLPHDRDRFDQIELPPFRSAIEAGVDAVMTAHVFAPELDAQNIATLSQPILTGLLRQEMGFDRLIVTDALVMNGVADRYSPEQVAVQAVIAGVDILLMPIDPVATISAIVAAVESGEIDRDRIRASVRIWRAKARTEAGASNSNFPIAENSIEEHQKIATEITVKSLRVHQGDPLQFDPDRPPINLIFVDNLLNCDFLTERGASIAKPRSLGCPQLLVDPNSIGYLNLDDRSQVIVQIFSRGNPFRGSAGVHQQIEELVKVSIDRDKLMAIAFYGSPYNLDRFVPLLPPTISWAFAYSQQPDAQQAVINYLID